MKIEEFIEPKTIKDAIEILNDIFICTDTSEIIYFNNSTSSDIMIEYHMSIGMKIRNAWLWPKNPNVYSDLYNLFNNLGFKNVDNMSGFLLKLFWHYKREPNISLEKHEKRMLDEIMVKNIIE